MDEIFGICCICCDGDCCDGDCDCSCCDNCCNDCCDGGGGDAGGGDGDSGGCNCCLGWHCGPACCCVWVTEDVALDGPVRPTQNAHPEAGRRKRKRGRKYQQEASRQWGMEQNGNRTPPIVVHQPDGVKVLNPDHRPVQHVQPSAPILDQPESEPPPPPYEAVMAPSYEATMADGNNQPNQNDNPKPSRKESQI